MVHTTRYFKRKNFCLLLFYPRLASKKTSSTQLEMNALELEEDDDIQPLTNTGSRGATSRRHLGSSHPSSIRGVPPTVVLLLFTLLSVGAIYHHMKTAEHDATTLSGWKMLSPKAATDAKKGTSLKSDNHPPVDSDYDTITASPTVTPVTASPSSAPFTASPSAAPVTSTPSSISVAASPSLAPVTVPINATKHESPVHEVSVSSNTSIGNLVLPNVLLIGAQKGNVVISFEIKLSMQEFIVFTRLTWYFYIE